MNSHWLKKQFETNPDKSKAGLARALQLEPPAVSKILNGGRQIKAHEYNLMRQYFGLPVDGERKSALHSNAYRLDMLAGDQNNKCDPHEELHPDSWVIPANIFSAHTQATPDQIKIFQVKEILMEPEYRRAEHVLIDMSDQSPSPPGAFIVSDGFGYMLRNCEYLPHSNPAQIRISASNSTFQTQALLQTDFKIIGRVIGKLQWL